MWTESPEMLRESLVVFEWEWNWNTQSSFLQKCSEHVKTEEEQDTCHSGKVNFLIYFQLLSWSQFSIFPFRHWEMLDIFYVFSTRTHSELIHIRLLSMIIHSAEQNSVKGKLVLFAYTPVSLLCWWHCEWLRTIILPLWMQDELELTSHKAKGIHQGEHLWKERCYCRLCNSRTNHFLMWHWVCMAWLVKIFRIDRKSSTSSEKLFWSSCLSGVN